MMHQHGAHARPPATDPQPYLQVANAWRGSVRPVRRRWRSAVALALICAGFAGALAALQAMPPGEATRSARTVTP